MNKPVFSGLPRRLVSEGVIDADSMQAAIEQAKEDDTPITRFLIEGNYIKSSVLALHAADTFGCPIFDVTAIDPEVIPSNIIDNALIQKHRVLPLVKRGNRLFLAIDDPSKLEALDEIQFNTGLSTEAVVVEADKLHTAIEAFLDNNVDPFSDLDDDLEGLEVDHEQQSDEGVDPDAVEDAPIVRFVNKVLLDAIKGGTSDIHFEPYEKAYRIRFRSDGILQEVARPPVSQATKLAARLKVMAQLDISERRIPQDGRIKLRVSKSRAIDFRVNCMPTLFGEKICLRILDPSSTKMGIDDLGYEPDQKDMYIEALHKPQGMCLVTGPTGSGKTVSLYTGLNILNTVERNISTAEDPVEFNFEGINQVNVNPKVGMDFAAALKAFLRQDPDVVMVGEIRDLDTASIAVKAAQTGHMVLSTLHTNSAPETLTRMRNMGVPAFNIATSVVLIIAQRLARRLCSSCKQPIQVPKKTLFDMGFIESDFAKKYLIYGPVGCNKCVNGYKGRVGIYEVVKITEAISRIIMEEGNALQISDQCKLEGFNDLRRSGILKVIAGLTSLAEVDRVTSG